MWSGGGSAVSCTAGPGRAPAANAFLVILTSKTRLVTTGLVILHVSQHDDVL